MLTPQNPAVVDDTGHSVNGDTAAVIDFVNRSRRAVDIYWIDYQRHRRLYHAGLAAGATYTQPTFLTHPFLVVVSGTSGTTERDTGARLAAFTAVAARDDLDPFIRNTAIITDEGEKANPHRPTPGGTDADGVFSPGNGVSQPSVLQKRDPDYSDVARNLRVGEATVLLRFVVQPDGVPRDIRVVRSVGYGLDEKAIEAVQGWRFKPAMKDGLAVSVRANVQVNFKLLRDLKTWYSGPLQFVPQPETEAPVVIAGDMPKPGGGAFEETVVLGFTVDSNGSVKGIHTVSGSQASADLLAGHLANWKFSPAMRGNEATDAAGTVRFTRGEPQE